MWGIYTVDSDTRRSPSFRDSLSYGGGSGSLENVRMLGVGGRANIGAGKLDASSRQNSSTDSESRKQLKLDGNGMADERHGSRTSATASRHDSERRLIRNAYPQPTEPQRQRRGPDPDPEAEAAAVREKRRRKIVFVIILVAASLLLMSILLMVITVQLTPAINEKVRQQHEEFARKQQQRNANHSHIVTNSSGVEFFTTINSTLVEQ